MNYTSLWGPFGWRPLKHINQDLIYTGVTVPHTCRAWGRTLDASFEGMGSNSLGHLNGMRLNEKKSPGVSLNKDQKKKGIGLCVGRSNKEADFHSASGKFC